MKRTRRNTGFSLIEMMTVVGIIGILAALSLMALEVLPQRTRLTGGALEFAAVVSSARSQAYGRNQRVVVLLNADRASLGEPINYWVAVDKWFNFAQAMRDKAGWKELNELKPGTPALATDNYTVYESGHFNSSVRVLPEGFKSAVGSVAHPDCAKFPTIGLARGQPSVSDDSFPPPYCFVPSRKACTFCSGDGNSTQVRGAIFFEPDGTVRFYDAEGRVAAEGAASITLMPSGGGLQSAQAVVITNTGLVRTFSASAR